MKQQFKILAALILILGLLVPAFAHKGASGIVLERMKAMSAMKDAIAIIGNMMRGRLAFDRQEAQKQAKALQAHAASMVSQFPDTKESRQKATKALETVWQKPDDFASIANELEMAAGKFADLAVAQTDTTALREPFSAIAKTCSSCHETYRKPE